MMTTPYRPTLPPKAGYVERDGEYVEILQESTGTGLDDDTLEFIQGLMEGLGYERSAE